MKYKRKTIDEFEIQGYYGYGWECLTTEENWREATKQLICYNEKEPNVLHRIVKKRVKK
jgi:hypothetical protein